MSDKRKHREQHFISNCQNSVQLHSDSRNDASSSNVCGTNNRLFATEAGTLVSDFHNSEVRNIQGPCAPHLAQSLSKESGNIVTNIEGLDTRYQRNIIGQDKNCDRNSASDLLPQECGPWIRPPLVGQASTSSNESTSNIVQLTLSPEDQAHECLISGNKPFPKDAISTFSPVDRIPNFSLELESYFPRDQTCIPPTREYFINELLRDGSAEQYLHMLTTEPQDVPRIPSPSSASSITSGRPLEWDSGADVGYQFYCTTTHTNEPGLSTIERIALARGSAVLLTRSDPEGTTDSVCQPVVSQQIKKAVNVLQNPTAESTPLSCHQLGIAQSSLESEEDISPIVNLHKVETHLLPLKSTKNSSQIPIDKAIEKSLSPTILSEICNARQNGTNMHFPLFPGVNRRRLDVLKRDEQPAINTNLELTKSSDINAKSSTMCAHLPRPMIRENDPDGSQCQALEFVSSKNSAEVCNTSTVNQLGLITKKSTSLENLHDSFLSQDFDQALTFPRSQSQRSLDDINLEHQKNYLATLHPTKSNSSSSITTIVQNKKESSVRPSKLIQTSSYMKQSIGIQTSTNDKQNIVDAPNSPEKACKCDIKSTYFKSYENCKNSAHQSIAQGFSRPTLAFEHSQCLPIEHNQGHPCQGAHRKQLDRQSPQSVRTDKLYGCRPNLQGQESEEEKFQFSTLGSAVSSSRTAGTSPEEERQESINVIDRANSFEYLPGHMYESAAARESQESSTSVTSNKENLWHSSTSNTLMKDVEKGVSLMMKFVQSSQARDSNLKHKLLRRVVEKLIDTNYSDDSFSPLIDNVNRLPEGKNLSKKNLNRRETRSHNKEGGSRETSSTVESSAPSSNALEMPQEKLGFSASPVNTHTATAEKCVGTSNSIMLINKRSVSSESNAMSETTLSNESPLPQIESNYSKRPPEGKQNINAKKTGLLMTPLERQLFSSECNTRYETTVSQESPLPHTDTSYDQRMPEEKQNITIKKKEEVMQQVGVKEGEATLLLDYLNLERQNQLFWIKSEITHLSNLKQLLERQEALKKNLKILRNNRTRHRSAVPINANHITRVRENYNHRKADSTETESPGNTNYNVKEKGIKKGATNLSDMEWSSHHYRKSLTAIPTTPATKTPISIDRNQAERKEVCKEKDSYFRRAVTETYNNKLHTKIQDKCEKEESSVHSGSNIPTWKRNMSTSTTDCAGVQTSKSVEKLPVIRPSWYRPSTQLATPKLVHRRKRSEMHNEPRQKLQSETVPKAVAYQITFEPSPRDCQESIEKASLEEVCLQIPQYCINEKHSVVSDNVKDKNKNIRNIQDRQRKTVWDQNNYSENSESDRVLCNTGNSELTGGNKSLHDGRVSIMDRDGLKKEARYRLGFREEKIGKMKDRQRPSLQDYLVQNRPKYVLRAESRRQCVAELQYLRELREKSRKDLLALAGEETSQQSTIPPPLLSMKRVFSQQSMRRQTERKYRQLAEVKNKKIDLKRKESYRTNRLMAEVFTKKLQKKTLRGEVNLSNSVSVIPQF